MISEGLITLFKFPQTDQQAGKLSFDNLKLKENRDE